MNKILLNVSWLLIVTSQLTIAQYKAKLVKNIRSGSESSYPQDFYVHNNKLYFSATNDTSGRELWVYDDNMGARMVYDINTGSQPSVPCCFTSYKDNLYFPAYKPTTGSELWVYDGSSDPEIWIDLIPGATTSYPGYLTVYKDMLFFTAFDSSDRRLMYSFDGTGGPSPVADINESDIERLLGYLSVFNDVLYFIVSDSTYGSELWQYDGTGAPSIVYDINAGAGHSGINYKTVFQNKLYFSANDGIHGQELWVYDGVTNPTLLYDINAGAADASPEYLTVFNDKLYFSATDSVNGTELWQYDGSTEPEMVADINPADSSDPKQFTAFKEELIFTASDGVSGRQIWSYDGSSNNPVPIEIIEGDSLVDGALIITAYNNKLLCTADYANYGIELVSICKNTSSEVTISACDSLEYLGTTYTTSGTYMVTIPNAGGCDSTITLHLTIENNDIDPTVTLTDRTLTAGSGTSYTWIDCDNENLPVEGANEQSYTPETSGNYAVIIDKSVCSRTSECTSVEVINSTLTINEHDPVQIYPNPAQNKITFMFNKSPDNADIRIYSIDGSVVQGYNNINSIMFKADISGLNGGIYLIQVNSGNQQAIYKLVKQ